MAKGRMLNKTITTSRKFNLAVQSDFTRLVYCLLLPQADRDGRLQGEEILIKSMLFPWREDLKALAIKESLTELHNSGLILWYLINDEKYIQITKFREGQENLRYDREPESIIPECSGNYVIKDSADDCRSNAGVMPEDFQQSDGIIPEDCRKNDGLREDKLREDKRSVSVRISEDNESVSVREIGEVTHTQSFYPADEVHESFTNPDIENPEKVILYYWQRLYNTKTATTTLPNANNLSDSLQLIKQVQDITLLKKCADAYFDDSQNWFFTQNKNKINGKIKRSYYFKSFVSNITALISHVQEQTVKDKELEIKKEQEKAKSDHPRKCPKCGKETVVYGLDSVGCRACRVVYEYDEKVNEWIQLE